MEKQMSRSTSTSSTRSASPRNRTRPARSTPASRAARAEKTSDTRRSDTSRLKHYTFRYNLDRVSRKAGSSNLVIASNGSNTSLTLTLQEARALYNFLDGHFDNA